MEKARASLVDGLTRAVSKAAGELVASAFQGLEDSPGVGVQRELQDSYSGLWPMAVEERSFDKNVDSSQPESSHLLLFVHSVLLCTCADNVQGLLD